MFIDKDSCINCLVLEKEDIRRVITAIDEGGLRIALIINNKGKLIGTISDGDIRRGLLKGLTLDSSLLEIVNKNCLKANLQTNRTNISRMMSENAIAQIPVVAENNEFIGLEISDDLLPNSGKSFLPNYALIMAGGRGSRLSPITDNCPKPLLPINEKPILEIILEQCIQSGIRNFFISVHYLAEKIINYFEDGSKWDVNITYLHEDSPLGTAGALKLLPSDFNKSLVLINGDVLTKINYQNLLKYHAINSADITICAREQILRSPYGVIEVDGIDFKSMIEKPSFRQLVNAGIYVLKPSTIALIRKEYYLDMPDFIDIAKKRQKKIIVYPMHEYWLDIGKPEALNKAHFEWS